MGLLDRFRKKEVEEKTFEEKKEKDEDMTDFERFFMDDREVYEALRRTMFLDPRNQEVSMNDAEKKAKEFEKKGDRLRALTWYEIAGRLAIYEGNVKKVKKYFGKCAELSPDRDYTILKIPEKAVKKAQEYYQKYLKE
jgi:hypothetical protein